MILFQKKQHSLQIIFRVAEKATCCLLRLCLLRNMVLLSCQFQSIVAFQIKTRNAWKMALFLSLPLLFLSESFFLHGKYWHYFMWAPKTKLFTGNYFHIRWFARNFSVGEFCSFLDLNRNRLSCNLMSKKCHVIFTLNINSSAPLCSSGCQSSISMSCDNNFIGAAC